MTFTPIPLPTDEFCPVPADYLLTFPNSDEDGVLASSGRLPELKLIPSGPDFPELGMKARDWDIAMHPENAIAELKVDGVGAIWIDGRFWSLQGVPLHCMAGLHADMRALEAAAGHPLVIQGEFTAGQFRDTLAALRSAFTPPSGRFWMFDALPFDEWVKDACTMDLMDRKVWLLTWADACQLQGSAVLRHWPISADQVRAHVELTAQAGLEGLVIKDVDSLFIRSPSSNWLRAKHVNTVDCEIVDIPEGGGLLVGLQGREMLVKQGVPKTAATRFNVGDIVELAWNIEPGSRQPRHLRFVRARPDKDLSGL